MIATTRGILIAGGVTQDALGDEIVPDGGYTEQLRNRILEPYMASTSNTHWALALSAMTALRELLPLEDGRFEQRVTKLTDGGAAAFNLYASRNQAGMPIATPGDVWTFGCTARASKAGLVLASSLSFGSGSSAATGNGTGVLSTEDQQFSWTMPIVSGTGSILSARFGSSDAANVAPTFDNGDSITVSRPFLYAGAIGAPVYTDGGLAEGPGQRYRWEGTPDRSASIFETTAAVGGDFPISIVERSRREFDEASNAWRTVRYFAGRCPVTVPVKAGDRIQDLRDSRIFIVEEVERMARGLSGRSSVTLTMKRTSP